MGWAAHGGFYPSEAGQCDDKLAAVAWFAFHFDLSAMLFGDALGNGETEARA